MNVLSFVGCQAEYSRRRDGARRRRRMLLVPISSSLLLLLLLLLLQRGLVAVIMLILAGGPARRAPVNMLVVVVRVMVVMRVVMDGGRVRCGHVQVARRCCRRCGGRVGELGSGRARMMVAVAVLLSRQHSHPRRECCPVEGAAAAVRLHVVLLLLLELFDFV